MTKKFLTKLAALMLGATLAAAAPLSAQADSAEDQLELVDTSITDIAEESWVDELGYVRLSPNELRELAAVQTPSEIEEVLETGGAVNLLIGDGDEVLAAAPAEYVGATKRAISTCFSGGAIIKRYLGGKSATHCYTGVGTLSVNLPSVYYVATAGYNITLYINGGTIPSSTISWNTSSHTYNTPINVYKLNRWAKA